TVAAKQTAAHCKALAKSCGHPIRAEVCRADISSGNDRRKLLEFAKKDFGRLDLLVNNAGVAPDVRADMLEATEESFDRLININVKGPYFLTQLAARWMIARMGGLRVAPPRRSVLAPGAEPSYQPKIVTISSISSYTASVNRGDYCISKAALSM